MFGRPLWDAFSFANCCVKFENDSIHPLWRDAWKAKEEALRARFVKSVENFGTHALPLPQLAVGGKVFVQNQSGHHPNKRSGLIVESKGNDQYLVKIDGTGRLTLRNRWFLRKYTLPNSILDYQSGQAISLANKPRLQTTHLLTMPFEPLTCQPARYLHLIHFRVCRPLVMTWHPLQRWNCKICLTLHH